MAKARDALSAAVVLLLVVGVLVLRTVEPGRGDEATSTDGVVEQATPANGGTPPPSPGGATDTTSVPTTGSKSTKAKAGSATTTTTVAIPIPENSYQYEVTLSPMCVVTGAPLTVTLHLQPGNGASIIVAYADGSTHGSRYQGYAGPDGKLTRTWPAGPVAGPAQLLTGATDSTGRSGGTRIEFRVVEATEPC